MLCCYASFQIQVPTVANATEAGDCRSHCISSLCPQYIQDKLPKLNQQRVNELMRFLLELPGAEITVDLPAQTVLGPDGKTDSFEIDAHRKHCLINGLDDIGLTLQKEASITAYEAKIASARPWV